jgi:hypothetical protein
MAGDLGLSSTFGVGAMQQSVRQRILDQLQQQAQAHQMSVEDQRLELERQRLQQDAADRSLLRTQQATSFNETIGEKAGANLGPGQSVLTPGQAAPILGAPSMRGLIRPDQTLPSTSMSAGAPLAGDTGGTAPTATTQAPQLTGQLRFMGTPQANQAEAQRVKLSQLTGSMPAGSPERRALDYEQATGKNAPAGIFDKTAAEPLEQVAGPNGPVFTPRSQAVGKTPYHVPPTNPDNKLVKVEHKDPTTGRTVIEWLPQSEVRGQTFQKGVSGSTETRLESAQAVNQTGEDIVRALSNPNTAAVVGPAMGRYDTLRDFLGNPPPEFSELAGQIESYALASMGVHGMRSAAGAEQIKKLLDAHHTPESLIAAIKGLNAFSNHFMQNEGRAPAAAPKPSDADPLGLFQK